MTESRPNRFKAWVEAMRLRTLPVSVAGVVAGCGCAAYYGGFSWPQALICLLFAIVAQIVSNFANEYFDFKNGLDRKGREGFRRGVTEGDISPRAMRNATFGLLGLDCLLGLSLIYWGGLWLLIPGILIALFAVAYSAGPYPLSHHGLGEVAVIIFFGIVPVCLTAYLQMLDPMVFRLAIPVSVAIGLMGANVLIVNNYRDKEDDEAVGKHTLVVILGRKFMSTVYLFNGIAASLLLFYPVSRGMSVWAETGVLIYLLLHILLWKQLEHKSGKELNPILGKTAMLMFLLSVWITVSYAVFR